MASAILLPTMLTVDQWTSGWTRRRVAGVLAILGFAAAGVPEGVHFGGWAVAVLALAVGLITAYATVLHGSI